MATALEIRLFGHPELHLQGRPLASSLPHKALALLYYLALAEQPVGRETLATLLWPEAPTATAKHSLRNLLSVLRKTLGDGLEITSRTVALQVTHRQSVDVVAFQQGVAAMQKAQSHGQPSDLAAWQATLDLYRGDFLAGFYIHQSEPFEAWTLLRRDYLRKQLITNLLALSDAYAANAATEAALACLDRLLEIEPENEGAYAEQIQLLLTLGRRTEALQRYERYRRMLAAEFDMLPSPSLTALLTELRTPTGGKATVAHRVQSAATAQTGVTIDPLRAPNLPSGPYQPAHHTVPTNLIRPLSAFVGRSQEVAYLCHRVTDADCRLLTVVGPGGMGKTSLALAVGQRLLRAQRVDFPDGIFFVPLADVGADSRDRSVPGLADDPAAGEAILRAIATQIGYKLASGISSVVQLQAYLRTRRLLLILDNFEQLLSGTDAVVTLLTKLPDLKVLVTSRARLNVRGESVLTLDHLSLPSAAYHTAIEAAQANPARTIEDDVWQASEAIAMFVQRAQQFDPHFTINADTIGPVGQICQLVEGLPLGIELATSMLPLLNCAALAQELARSLNFLAADTRDLPSEQRTLGVVFERSWRLLPAEGQQLLARLSIFPGSFHRDAAERIVGASSALLRCLLDQSLLSKAGDDRYTLHRTVHAFAQQKLQQWPEQIEALHVQYAHFYLEFLARMESGLTGTAYAAATEQIQADLDNVRTAWRRAVNHHMYSEINRCLNAIYLFYEQQGFYLDSIALYDQALVHFGPSYEKPQHKSKASPMLNLVMGRLQAYFGWCNIRLGRFPQALAAYASSWSILQHEENPIAAAICLGLWGASTKGRNPQRSAELLTESLRLAQVSGVAWAQVLIGQSLGETIFLLGDYAAAKAYITAGYTLAQQLNWPRGLTSGAKSLGQVNLSLGYYRQAEEHLREGIGLARQHHLNILGLEGVITLGEALRRQGRLAEARSCFAESRRLATALGAGEFIAPILWEEGCLAEQRGEYGAAKAHFNESLAIGIPMWWLHARPTLGWALIGLGELAEAQAYFQKVLNDAQAQERMPISLDAQVGLAYIQRLRAPSSPTLVAKSERIFQDIYRHPALTAETRQRLAKIVPEFDLWPIEKFISDRRVVLAMIEASDGCRAASATGNISPLACCLIDQFELQPATTPQFVG